METKIVIYFIFIAINFFIAIENRNERNNHIATGNPDQVNHTFWAIVYTVPCALIAWWNWKIGISVLLLHASLFPVMYNTLVHIAPFNLSKTTTSKYDQFLVKLGLEDMVLPDVLAFTASLFLLWI